MRHLPDIAGLGVADDNGFCTGRVAEVVLQPHPTGRELVADPAASARVAKSDVVRSREALGIRSVETGSAAVVDATLPTANIADAGAAVGDNGVLGRTRNDVVGDRFSEEGEVSVGGREPVLHFGLSDDEGGDLLGVCYQSSFREDASRSYLVVVPCSVLRGSPLLDDVRSDLQPVHMVNNRERLTLDHGQVRTTVGLATATTRATAAKRVESLVENCIVKLALSILQGD